MKPLIGITTYREQARWGSWDSVAAVLPASYMDKVDATGARPVLLPPYPDGAKELVAALDGLIVAGGADVEPARYGAVPGPRTTSIRPDRDTSEIALLEAAISAGLPVLGICRGMQLLNVACGGDLVQHVPDIVGTDDHQPASGEFNTNGVSVDPDSLIGKIVGASAQVACSHHQAVGRLGSGLRAVAWAMDGTVEGIEHTEHPFVIGVQWHPEEGADAQLFAALTERAAMRKM